MPVRIATFNAENLFARYRFRDNVAPSLADGFTRNDLAFRINDDDSKRITGRLIRDADVDILCLQEVESLGVLERFNSRYLGGMGYRHRLVIDSHDPRFIDVAVLSRHPFTHVATHRDERNGANSTWLFSRDCLEVDVTVDGTTLSLYVNHLKSMLGGRAQTQPRRLEQAQRVADIVDDWWADDYQGSFVVLGDLNDYAGAGSGIDPLLNHPELRNVIDRRPANDRWTHYWARGNQYHQLDYLLLSDALAQANPGAPEILREGLPWRADRYTGPRLHDRLMSGSSSWTDP